MPAPRFQPLSFDYGEPTNPTRSSGNFLNSYINSFYGNQNRDQNQGMDQNAFGQLLNERYGQQDQQDQQGRPDPYQRFNSGDTSYMNLIRNRESGGKYNIRNSSGYSGGYQFGAQALEATGLLKPGTGKMGNKALEDPNNWTIPGGLNAFLNNRELQDTAFKKFTNMNENVLRKMGVINQNTSPQQVNALLAAAHISGPGGAAALMRGQDRKDPHGGSARGHYNTGMKATSRW